METNLPSGIDGSIARSSVESSPKAVTKQDVERAREEERKEYGRLLDTMEASVNTQGKYFVKLGEKRPITEARQVTGGGFLGVGRRTSEQKVTTGYEDDRAFILNATLKREGNNMPSREDFVVVTPDGIYVIPFHHADIDTPKSSDAMNQKSTYDMLRALTSGQKSPDESNKYRKPDSNNGGYYGVPTILITDKVGNRIVRLENPNYILPFTNEDFERVLKDSINMTESPHRKNFDAAVSGKQLASNASTTIGNLPPRG